MNIKHFKGFSKKANFILAASIFCSEVSVLAICGNNQPGDCTPHCTTDKCTGVKTCTTDSIALYTGNERRIVTDLEIAGGVGEHQLSWTRYGNSRLSNAVNFLGNSHNWRHGYQWEFTVASDAIGPLSVTVCYPDGAIFRYKRIGSSLDYVSVASATDKLSLNDARDTFTLTAENGFCYSFGVTASQKWRLNRFFDSQQNVYTLTYDTGNRLVQVREPAGRFLKISYATLPISAANDVVLSTLTIAPPDNQWSTVSLTNTTPFRYLRYQGPDNKYSQVAEIQFLDGAGQPLAGTAFGGAAVPVLGNEVSKAFDGNISTSFRSSLPTGDFSGIDLGTPQVVAAVKYFPAAGKGVNMLNGRFIGCNNKPANLSVITKVETNDGRVVSYDYTPFADPTLPIVWHSLSAAHYGDGEVASYGYTQPYPSSRPLLSRARDPRVVGKGTALSWGYENSTANIVGYTNKESNANTSTQMLAISNVGYDIKVTSANGGAEIKSITHATGLLNAQVDQVGGKTTFTYDQGGAGFLATVTDPLLRTTQYTRSAFGNILTQTNPDGSVKSWTRDDRDLVLTETDELGRVTAYTRDAKHRVTRVDFPDGAFETFTYNLLGQVLDHQLRNGGVEHATYDSRGLKTSQIDPLGNVTKFTYTVHDGNNPTPSDLLASVTDANGNTTSYDYSERGQLVAQRFADGSCKSFAYDAFGNQISVTNELGNRWAFGYDEFKRKVSVTDPMGRFTSYDYSAGKTGSACGSCNSTDKPSLMIYPSGKGVRIVYDLNWRKISETMGYGTNEAATTEYIYDYAGNLLKSIDPLGHEIMYKYDLRNRIISKTDPLGNQTQWSYDQVGNNITEQRSDAGVTSMIYDSMNRIISTADHKGQNTKFTYDAGGNIVAFADGRNNVTQFTYDLLNRRSRKTYPDGSYENWSYDSVGNQITTKRPAGQILTTIYDARNRSTLLQWSDATPAVTKLYDAAGRVSALKSSVSTLTYTYNTANQLLSETQSISAPVNLASKTVGYTYDADGNRASIVYPDGSTIAYSYTGRNQVAAIAADGPPPLVTYSYDLVGNRLGKTLENGTSTTYKYDDADRLLKVDALLGTVPLALAYTLDTVGNRVSRTESLGSDVHLDQYTYDTVDQLTQVKYDVNGQTNQQARQVDYAYDASGNRSNLTDASNSTNYIANALNQYTAISGVVAPAYDKNGNLVSYQSSNSQTVWSYQYDAQSRLIGGYSGANTFSFVYDARNRCVARTINGVTTLNVYDGWDVIEDRGANDVQLAKYYRGASTDEILATVTVNGAMFHHQDGLGNVVALTDASGHVTERYSYDVYGAPTFLNAAGIAIIGSASANRFLYTGREWFPALGLQDNRNRYYIPQLGQWLSRDPMEEKGGVNLYGYVGNNPIGYTDAFGLSTECSGWAEYKRDNEERVGTRREYVKSGTRTATTNIPVVVISKAIGPLGNIIITVITTYVGPQIVWTQNVDVYNLYAMYKTRIFLKQVCWDSDCPTKQTEHFDMGASEREAFDRVDYVIKSRTYTGIQIGTPVSVSDVY